jgi:ABC-type dipeptide/oligopeptide/nickel transport system permease subunit
MTTTVLPEPAIDPFAAAEVGALPGREPSENIWARALRSRRVAIGGGILLVIVLVCLGTLFMTVRRSSSLFYDHQQSALSRTEPKAWPPQAWYGYDGLGRSIFARCLLGGTISMGVGIAAATISVILGVAVGLLAGFRGGLVDSALMRTVDVLYGLPYILLVILFKIAFEGPLGALLQYIQPTDALQQPAWFNPTQAANLVVLFSAIGLVSWLTMARVVRGQVLSLRSQPFIESCRAMGLPETRIFLRHILPNLVGPITVYATLTVPSAILQESFLSFLGVGVNPPLPSWGSLAAEGVQELSPVRLYWWMLIFPCILLVVTLLSLNFMGDGLRDIFDPKREGAKI